MSATGQHRTQGKRYSPGVCDDKTAASKKTCHDGVKAELVSGSPPPEYHGKEDSDSQSSHKKKANLGARARRKQRKQNLTRITDGSVDLVLLSNPQSIQFRLTNHHEERLRARRTKSNGRNAIEQLVCLLCKGMCSQMVIMGNCAHWAFCAFPCAQQVIGHRAPCCDGTYMDPDHPSPLAFNKVVDYVLPIFTADPSSAEPLNEDDAEQIARMIPCSVVGCARNPVLGKLEYCIGCRQIFCACCVIEKNPDPLGKARQSPCGHAGGLLAPAPILGEIARCIEGFTKVANAEAAKKPRIMTPKTTHEEAIEYMAEVYGPGTKWPYPLPGADTSGNNVPEADGYNDLRHILIESKGVEQYRDVFFQFVHYPLRLNTMHGRPCEEKVVVFYEDGTEWTEPVKNTLLAWARVNKVRIGRYFSEIRNGERIRGINWLN